MIGFFKSFHKTLAVYIALLLVFTASVTAAGAGFASFREQEAMKENRFLPIEDIFHDQGELYMSTLEPETTDSLTLRLRAPRYNVTKAQIQYTKDMGQSWDMVEMSFDEVDATGYYDYWAGTIPPQTQTYYYRFAVENESKNSTVYLGAQAVSPFNLEISEMFCVIPGFRTPQWSKGALWYSVNTDAFYNGDSLNDLSDTDKRKALSWNSSVPGLHDRYGGDLKGLQSKIEYLQGLGVESVYLNPVWKSSVNVGYGPAAYDEISPYLGNEQDLISLISSLHENGMKIILDAVFSYGSLEGKWYNSSHYFPLPGAAQSLQSPYGDMFYFYQWPKSYRPAWGNAALNFSSDTVKQEVYQSPDSVIQRYLKAPYSVDGWRFDAVENYWGTDTDQHQVAADMKAYIKSINPDALLMREEFVEDSLYKGIWESAWGNDFLFATRNWFDKKSNQQGLMDALNDNYRLPRALGLSIYNHFSQHDHARLFEDTQAQLSEIQAAQILLMTYIGAPCIYYGDEIGVSKNTDYIFKEQYRNNFDWDESAWNYDIYNLQKALGQLRGEYSALKTGVQKTGLVDDVHQLVVFGRWNQEGTVISMLNQSALTQTQTLDVKQFNVRDGQILTDYLTGQTYRVKDGKIDVVIIPGGSVLVTGKAGDSRGAYTLMDLGKKAEIVRTQADAFTLFGKGSVSGGKDDLCMAGRTLYGNGSLSAKISGKGAAVLTVRANDTKDSAAYSVVATAKEATVYARQTAGQKSRVLTKAPLQQGDSLRVERQEGGTFLLWVQNAGGEWKAVDDSRALVTMPSDVLAGFAPITGETILEQVLLQSGPAQLSDSFDQAQTSMLTPYMTKDASFAIQDGEALLSPKEGESSLFSHVPAGDWTIKTQLGNTSGTAGLIARANGQEGVAVVRMQQDGQPVLAVGRLQNGVFVPHATAGETQIGAPVRLQLQKVGSFYSAVYSYDGDTWDMIGSPVFANYSTVDAGIFSKGADASFAFVSFGNAIDDGQSVNTPRWPAGIETDFYQMNGVQVWEDTEILHDKGQWEYAVGGMERVDSDGVSQMAITNKTFDDFRAEVTLTPRGKGSAGFTFGRAALTEQLDNGFVVRLSHDGVLTLSRDGRTLLNKTMTVPELGLRVVAERVGSVIRLYAGQEGTFLGAVTDDAYPGGYFTFFAQDGPAGIHNYCVNNLKSNWTDVLGAYSPSFQGENGNIQVTTADLSLANIQGLGMTDLLAACRIDVNGVDEEKDAYQGILIGASQGYLPHRGGVLLALHQDGRLILSAENKEVASVTLEGQPSVDVMMTAKNGLYQVYLNGGEQPSLTYQSPVMHGGVFALVSENSKGCFLGLEVYDLTNVSSPTDHAAFAQTAKGPQYRSQAFTESFDRADSFAANWVEVAGSWQLKDGVLTYPTNLDRWTNCSSIAGSYNDFKAKFRMRFNSDDDSGFAGFAFGKEKPRHQYVDSGYCLTVTNGGQVKIYDSRAASYLEEVGYVPDFDAGGSQWLDVELIKAGSQVTVFINGNPILKARCSNIGGGYVSFHASNCRVSFDALTIDPKT